MTRTDIVRELKGMTPADRLMVAEEALRLLRDDLQQNQQPVHDRTARKRKLADAAQALLSDYTTDKDLTAFTSLDGEDFHASK